MSIPGSSKPLLAISAMMSALLLFVLINSGLMALSSWAERDVGAHPFKSEDWLRYLLPSRLPESTGSSIMLAGPSTVRENLRFEQFETEFPDYSIFNGGISGGTIIDTMTALNYIEMTRGQAALPDIIVLGVSPRFIAGFGAKTRIFHLAIDRYSPYYRVVRRGGDVELAAKGPIESISSTIRFFSKKQPERYRTAIFATAYFWFSKSPYVVNKVECVWRSKLGAVISRVLKSEHFQDVSFMDKLAYRISPYKYRQRDQFNPQRLRRAVNERASIHWWPLVFNWDVATNAAASRWLTELVSFADRNQIRLLVINMPEIEIARNLYGTQYNEYLRLVKTTIGDAPFVDLSEFLTTEEFYDLNHSTPTGARRLTAEVIGLVESMINNGDACVTQKSYACNENGQ